jgi:sterol 3beta-glucosyltransferase
MGFKPDLPSKEIKGIHNMQHIAIVASGTRGDVQPYIALGQGLKQAGYPVRLLTSDDFEPLVTGAGLEFCSTGGSIEAIIQSDEWRRTMERGNFLVILSRMQAEMKRHAAVMAQKMPPLLEGSDLIIAGTAGMSAFTIADAMKIPFLQAYVFPFTPTGAFPAPLVPKLPVHSAVINKVSFDITRQMLWQSSKAMDVETRKVMGLKKGSFLGPYRSLNQRQIPAMYGYSHHVLPRPNDWHENHVVTGYWFLDAEAGWQPPADLLDFLNAGDPPVYIGFGSMGSRNPEDAAAIALDALKRSGQRGLLASGWGGLQASDVPESVHLISSLPHRWLFPRMAAVVHHGGAGTTAAGFSAGVPSIIIPFMGDQPFWGQRARDLGVGPAPIPRKKLTGERLAAAIRESVTNNGMRQQAKALGEKIASENGVGNAVAFVERYGRRLPGKAPDRKQ